jgi:hypothetical protein
MDSFNRSYPAFASFCWFLIFLFGEVSGSQGSTDPYAAWDDSLTPAAAAPFAAIRPFIAEYRFGWEGLGAGGASVRVTARPSGRSKILAHGGPNPWIRKLWNYRALYIGEAGCNGEVPSWFHMNETASRGDLQSDAFCSQSTSP